MRDRRFIAQHRGGPLKKEEHHQLIKWATQCAEHVLPLYAERTDERLTRALEVAYKWGQGEVTVGDARRAAVAAHKVARESASQTAVYVARSVGHAVATAHMADHSLGSAWYALKAVKMAGKSVDEERKWQDEQLPPEIRELVLTARETGRFKKI
jgi:hypothetical protein